MSEYLSQSEGKADPQRTVANKLSTRPSQKAAGGEEPSSGLRSSSREPAEQQEPQAVGWRHLVGRSSVWAIQQWRCHWRRRRAGSRQARAYPRWGFYRARSAGAFVIDQPAFSLGLFTPF